MAGRGRPSKWARGPDGKYLKDSSGNYIPIGSEPAQSTQIAALSTANNPLEFDSVEDFILAASTSDVRNVRNQRVVDNLIETPQSDWYGLSEGANVSGVVDIVRKGWDDGASRLFDMVEEIKIPDLEKITRERVWLDQGEDVDVQRVFDGEEHVWSGFKTKKSRSNGREVKITINVSVSAWVEAENFFWTGAACVALTDALTRAGYAVCVDLARGAHNTENTEPDLFFKINLKQASDPLSISSLASTVCMAGFFRAVCITYTAKMWSEYCGHGVAKSIGDWRPPHSGIFIPSASLGSRNAAISWVNERLAEFA